MHQVKFLLCHSQIRLNIMMIEFLIWIGLISGIKIKRLEFGDREFGIRIRDWITNCYWRSGEEIEIGDRDWDWGLRFGD